MFTAKEPFRLLPEEHTHLQQLLRSTRVSAGLARRARTMLLLADGVSLRHIQAQTGMSPRVGGKKDSTDCWMRRVPAVPGR